MKKKLKKIVKKQLLAEKLTENSRVLEELDLLFDLVPPHMLRRSISEIFWAYLCNTEQKDYKPDMKEIANDFNCLFRFLEVAEMYERAKEASKQK